MAEEAASSLLGGSTTRFCFAREDFLRDTFDVDEFISSCRRRTTLENLHDDLSAHYKALKNAMMELINKDYADFVSLSSSLVGLEREIANILVPLGQLREEVSMVKGTVDITTKKLERLLEQRADYVKKKATLERYLVISQKLDSIEQLLRIDESVLESGDVSVSSEDGSEDVLERVTSAFNELQFQVEQARDSAFVSAITPRISAITSSLQTGLEKSFEAGLASNDSQRLHRCLRTYSAIDRTSAVEALFRTSVVRPHLTPIISSHSSLDDIYPAILEFVSSQCSTLVMLTTSIQPPRNPSAAGQSEPSLGNVQGVDFLVNAVWPEIVSLLSSQTPAIFASGNPDAFHTNYKTTMNFLHSFERLCRTQTSAQRLRRHPSYEQFMKKWSLSVYFQLRFQEIAWALEESLGSAFSSHDDTTFRCWSTCALWSSLQRCWSESVYLDTLAHRFWKLTLQLISRYTCWGSELELEQSATDSGGRDSGASGGSAGTAVSGSTARHPTASSTGSTASCVQIINAIMDIDQLLNKLPAFLSSQIQRRLVSCGSTAQLTTDGMLESRLALKQLLPRLDQLVSESLCQDCLVHLDAAKTIPRLYRHTNRAAPTEACAYVSNVVRHVQEFTSEHHHCGKTFVQPWCTDALSQVCVRYKGLVSDILLSVKKTEDSMLRLKRARRSTANAAIATTASDMSDEDKIRLQLLLDVQSFARQMDDLGYSLGATAVYRELFALVEPASNSSQLK